jgi:hypothetical protein
MYISHPFSHFLNKNAKASRKTALDIRIRWYYIHKQTTLFVFFPASNARHLVKHTFEHSSTMTLNIQKQQTKRSEM